MVFTVPTVMENPGKINFPGKSGEICEKLEVVEKIKKFLKFCERIFLL